MSTQTPQKQVEYNGNKYNLAECRRCKAQIFFIAKGQRADGKTDWELHNPDGTLHDHPKSGFSGSSSPPPAIGDVVLIPLLLTNQPDAAKRNQELITALQASGFEIAVNKTTHCAHVEFDPVNGPVLQMFKRK